MQLTQEELFAALRLLVAKIEACGASPALTDAVMLAVEIQISVGNTYNPPNPAYAAMVRRKLEQHGKQ